MDIELTDSKSVQCQSIDVYKKGQNVLVRKLMFTDNNAFVAHNYQDVQEMIPRFSKSFGQ